MYNFETMCRTCSCTGDLQPLFDDKHMIIAEMLIEIVNIKVMKDDDYPQNICIYCLERLTDAYFFKKQCHEIYTKFQEYLQTTDNQRIIVKSESPSNLDIKEPEIVLKETGVFLIHHESDDSNQEDNDLSVEYLENMPIEKIEIEENLITKQIQSTKKVRPKHLRLHKLKQELSENHFVDGEVQDEQQNIIKKESIQSKKGIKRIYGRHQCPICLKKVKSVKEHLRSHTKEKPFECEICGTKFSLRRNCLRHMKLHTGNKSYACNVCNQRFYEKFALGAHMRRHSTDKPFKCDLCDKSYKRKSHLKLHVSCIHEHSKTHVYKNVYKPYLCNHCGKTFSTKPQLEKHELVHTGDKPYKCSQCTLSFRQSAHLKRHYFTHTGEKRYKCNVCDKKFAANGNLTVHMRIHTGETPYICSICNKGFYDSSSLKKHLQNH